MTKPPHITVFGGSQPQPGQPAYQEAQRLGELLGQAGCTVLTGGYIGTMEAVSRGAAEAGGHVIGVTCDEIEAWRPVQPNQWVQEEMRFPKLRQRLYALMENCDAALALPGGIGTLAEVAVMWSQMQTGALPARPLILIGDAWKQVFARLIEEMGEYIPPAHQALLNYAADVDQAMIHLRPILSAKS